MNSKSVDAGAGTLRHFCFSDNKGNMFYVLKYGDLFVARDGALSITRNYTYVYTGLLECARTMPLFIRVHALKGAGTADVLSSNGILLTDFINAGGESKWLWNFESDENKGGPISLESMRKMGTVDSSKPKTDVLPMSVRNMILKRAAVDLLELKAHARRVLEAKKKYDVEMANLQKRYADLVEMVSVLDTPNELLENKGQLAAMGLHKDLGVWFANEENFCDGSIPIPAQRKVPFSKSEDDED